jgi:hypothetical protein
LRKRQSVASNGEKQAMYDPILAPVVALVVWTIVMMVWMYATRFPAMRRKGISLKGRVGSKTGSLEGVVEDRVNWKAHNYNHLMEQPTLFYAIALSLALMGMGGGINLYLAWAYVLFRVLHSLVQATTNIVLHRFILFLLASAALVGLVVHAAAALIHG